MQPRRIDRIDDERNDNCEHISPAAIAETLRNAAKLAEPTPPAKSAEERMSLFWRVFGGTIVSIGALVLITAYQSHSNAIHELRMDLGKANEARAELVKKDEYGASRTKIWDRIQDVQKDIQQLDPLKSRLGQLEEHNRALIAESKDTHELHATIKERLAQFEQQLNGGKATQKDVQVMQQSIAALQEKSQLRDQQFKQAESDRKELTKELQALRERLAKVEARKEAATDAAKVSTKHDE